jgi:hypothetical protein
MSPAPAKSAIAGKRVFSRKKAQKAQKEEEKGSVLSNQEWRNLVTHQMSRILA